MTTSTDPAPRLVAGRYRLGTLLGRGAMGTVWSAHDEVLGRPVAVKEVLLPPGIPDAEAAVLRERSLREARAIAVLSHPNVVTLYDVVREGDAPFVVMELVASHSLAEMLRTGPLPAQRVVAIGAAVAAALQAAHAAGITHRDVKPGNVLVAHDGRIKLTDFGIARNPADQTMTATGLMLGSPAYIAPEVASGGQVSPAADLWGLGATLFAAVEGRPPYDAGDPLATVSSVVLGEVPAPSCTGVLAEVISGLMVKDPAGRMTLAQVRAGLGTPQLAEPATPSRPPTPPPPPTPAAPAVTARSTPRSTSTPRAAPSGFTPRAAPSSSAPSSSGPSSSGPSSSGPPAAPTPAAPPVPATTSGPATPAGPSTPATRPESPPSEHPGPGPAAPATTPQPSPGARLADEPGPLPFAVPAARPAGSATPAPAGRAPTPPPRLARGRRRRPGRTVVLWTLAVLLFLAATSAAFAATRIVGGEPVLPQLGGGADAVEAPLADRVVKVTEADGSEPGTFTAGVPEGWPEFRDHGLLGSSSGAVVRFVSPDGTELVAVERVTGFLDDHDSADYLARHRRELAEAVTEISQSGPEQLPGGRLQATFRTRQGQSAEGSEGDLRRTSYLHLVPAGSDLWVVRVSVPTERERSGRTDLFEPVVSGFRPGS